MTSDRSECYLQGMVRLARVVAPGVPRYVTQRGNSRQFTFFGDDDHLAYNELMAEWSSFEMASGRSMGRGKPGLKVRQRPAAIRMVFPECR